jgi:membrane-bound serine protease (ClpP class)
VSIPLGGITAFVMALALKARRNKVVTGEQGLVGETGVARTALGLAGKVFVHGEIWNAIASAEVPEGERIVVRRVEGLLLHVDPASVDTTIPSRQTTPA